MIEDIATDAAGGGKHTTVEYIKDQQSKPNDGDKQYPQDPMEFYMNNNEMDPESTINKQPNEPIDICRYCSRDLPDGFVCGCGMNNDDDTKSDTTTDHEDDVKSEIKRFLYCYSKTKKHQIKFIFCHCCYHQNELEATKCTQCGNSLVFNKENEAQLIPIDSAWRRDQSVDRGLRYNPNGVTSTCM